MKHDKARVLGIGGLLISLCFAQSTMGKPQDISFDKGTPVSEAAHLFRTQSKKMACDLEPAGSDGKTTQNPAKTELVCERFEPTYLIVVLTADKAPEVLSEGRDAGGDRIEDPIILNDTWWSNDDFGCLSEEAGLTCKNKAGYGFLITDKDFKKISFSKH